MALASARAVVLAGSEHRGCQCNTAAENERAGEPMHLFSGTTRGSARHERCAERYVHRPPNPGIANVDVVEVVWRTVVQRLE